MSSRQKFATIHYASILLQYEMALDLDVAPLFARFYTALYVYHMNTMALHHFDGSASNRSKFFVRHECCQYLLEDM